VASKGRVGDCGKGRAGLVSPKAAVQPLELLLPILQSLQASNQMKLINQSICISVFQRSQQTIIGIIHDTTLVHGNVMAM